MLTECVYAAEQWLIKAKTFCGKVFFKKSHKQLQQKNPWFSRSLTGWET